MSKEELKQLLKENLKVNVYTVGTRIKCSIFFDGEEITQSDHMLNY